MNKFMKNIFNLVTIVIISFMAVMGFMGDFVAEYLGIPQTSAIVGSSILGIPLAIIAIFIYRKTKK